MGIRNVEKVYAVWSPRLGHLPMRVLVWMAYRALDTDQSPRYWGGWEELAYAAGRMVPEHVPGDRDVARLRRAALKSVSAVMEQLRQAGAVRLLRPAAPGRNAEYALILRHAAVHGERESKAVDNPGDIDPDRQNGSRSADTTVHVLPDNGSRSACTTVHAHRAPEEKQEEQEIAQEGNNSLSESPSPSARAGLAATQENPPKTTGTAPPAGERLPDRCHHGLKSRIRDDGLPTCALCRRERAGPTTLAAVVPLHRRTA